MILPVVLAVAAKSRGVRKMHCRTVPALGWRSVGVALVALQITLGAFTIWTNKAADVATAHVATGASLLVWAVLTYAAVQRWRTWAFPWRKPRLLRQRVEALA